MSNLLCRIFGCKWKHWGRISKFSRATGWKEKDFDVYICERTRLHQKEVEVDKYVCSYCHKPAAKNALWCTFGCGLWFGRSYGTLTVNKIQAR